MFVIFAAAAILLFGFIVEHLWNWLIPGLFGWHTITFWQALGLLLLSKILFGGFHRHGRRGRGGWQRHRNWQGQKGERWKQMTPEEREKFRSDMRGCVRGFARGPQSSSQEAPNVTT